MFTASHGRQAWAYYFEIYENSAPITDAIQTATNIPSSVFVTKTSNIYHNSNCPELSTEDLVEFATSQKAQEAGGVPCKTCNPKSSSEENTTGDKPGKSRTTYEWTGWKSLFENK